MKKLGILGSTVLFAMFSGAAFAGPQNGFGLNAGSASHTRSCGGCLGSSSSGLSIGMDYQFALNNEFSISPFLMSSGETNSNIANTTIGHGILGVQLRYWLDDMFVGGHVGRYSEVLTVSAGGFTASTSGNGGGSGLVAGWENPKGGMYVMGQFDSATINYTFTSVPITAFRLSVGYRWK